MRGSKARSQSRSSRRACGDRDSTSPFSDRYELSFSVGGLLEREAAIIVAVYLEHGDWSVVRRIAIDKNLLQTRTRSSAVRMVRETIKRLSVLVGDQLRALPELTAAERAHVMWAAACRRYALIGEFAEEVLRERFLTLTPIVDREAYDTFIRNKAIWHEELDALSPSTAEKLRQKLFKMMTDAALLSPEGVIEPVILSPTVSTLLTPDDFRFFPMRVI
ncbi:DUF1819 family protein [Actinomyces sp. B33]|nr:DUF1819 family protein [Actinomyces sp. B33]MDC4232441.1 DUF1819 family protein [Actinomyces sp. B33]